MILDHADSSQSIALQPMHTEAVQAQYRLIIWYCLSFLLLGWVSGVHLGCMVNSPHIPPYRVLMDPSVAQPLDALEPGTILRMALVPEQPAVPLGTPRPYLCAYAQDEDALRPVSIPYQLQSNGLLVVRGPVPSLQVHATPAGKKNGTLILVLTSEPLLCHPFLIRTLLALERVLSRRTQSTVPPPVPSDATVPSAWTSHPLASRMGLQVLELGAALKTK